MVMYRIYKPAKTAMQSGRGKTQAWILEPIASSPARPEPLMGWNSSVDTEKQVRLRFASRELAIAYAEKNNLSYTLNAPHERNLKQKSYADRFVQPPTTATSKLS